MSNNVFANGETMILDISQVMSIRRAVHLYGLNPWPLHAAMGRIKKQRSLA